VAEPRAAFRVCDFGGQKLPSVFKDLPPGQWGRSSGQASGIPLSKAGHPRRKRARPSRWPRALRDPESHFVLRRERCLQTLRRLRVGKSCFLIPALLLAWFYRSHHGLQPACVWVSRSPRECRTVDFLHLEKFLSVIPKLV